jgi:hypothetical protein
VHERMAARLAELLLHANLITTDQLEQAIAQQKVDGGRLVQYQQRSLGM